MEQQLKDQWVNALRSGEYKQATGHLRRADADGGNVGYCCLGVLKEIQGATWKKAVTQEEEEGGIFDTDEIPANGDAVYYSEADYNGKVRGIFADTLTTYPTDKDLNEWGLGYHMSKRLAEMNDGGCTFEDIADYLEEADTLYDFPPETSEIA